MLLLLNFQLSLSLVRVSSLHSKVPTAAATTSAVLAVATSILLVATTKCGTLNRPTKDAAVTAQPKPKPIVFEYVWRPRHPTEPKPRPHPNLLPTAAASITISYPDSPLAPAASAVAVIVIYSALTTNQPAANDVVDIADATRAAISLRSRIPRCNLIAESGLISAVAAGLESSAPVVTNG